jgi:hypothetical protein
MLIDGIKCYIPMFRKKALIWSIPAVVSRSFTKYCGFFSQNIFAFSNSCRVLADRTVAGLGSQMLKNPRCNVLPAQDSEWTMCVLDLNRHLTMVRLQKLLSGREVSLATVSLLGLSDLEEGTRSSCSLPLRVLPFSDPSLPEGIKQVRPKEAQQYCSWWSPLAGEVKTDRLTADWLTERITDW